MKELEMEGYRDETSVESQLDIGKCLKYKTVTPQVTNSPKTFEATPGWESIN